MFGITSLIIIISFYILIPLVFLIARKKIIRAVKKRVSLKELKQQKEWNKITNIVMASMLVIYSIISYETFISSPLHSVNFILILLAMFFLDGLYMFFVNTPIIKEKEKEQEENL